MKLFFLLTALILTGCNSDGDRFTNMGKQLSQHCLSPLSIEVTANGWTNRVTVKCDGVDKKWTD